MKVKRILIAALCSMAMCVPSFAQTSLTHERNGMLVGEFARHSIDFFDAGQGGENLLWEYPIELLDDHETMVSIDKDIIGIYRMTDGEHAEFYIEKPDSQEVTLFQCAEENPLSKIEYMTPLLRMQYPFEYGDTITRPFMGKGVYCGDHHFLKRGATTVMADATGALVVDENDTIHNVLRVYTLKSYSLCMDLSAAALDTAKLRQVIEERYEWYARGYRYPVLETVTSTSYHNLTKLGTTQKAWCCLPSEQLALNDSVNHEVQRQDSIALAEKALAEKDIIHYAVSVSNGSVRLNYSLDEDAHIVTMLADAFGMVYRRSDWTQEQGENYTRDTDCSGLRRGTYIFYINVNGRIYSEKVSL